MEFITIDDISDKILQIEDVTKANDFVTSLGISLGIQENQMVVTWKTKRVAEMFACYDACLSSVGSDGSAVFDGTQNTDIFASKLELYRKELDRLVVAVVASDFTNEGKPANKTSIPIFRA